MAAWVFLWPKAPQALTVERRLIEQGYSPHERFAIRVQLQPDEALALSVEPYRADALAYYGNPVYRRLWDHGYRGNDLEALSVLDHHTTLNLMRFDVLTSPQRYITDRYFLWSRFDRYMAQAQQSPSLSGRALVERVNTNRDVPYYTQTQAALGDGVSILVNKYYALDASFTPSNLVKAQSCGQPTLAKEAADAFDRLCEAVKARGLDLGSSSAYRSYARQRQLYDYYVRTDGQANADTYSARPGHSEHQTGLAVDFNAGSGSIDFFINTDTYAWVSVNSWRFGFILRYPQNKTDITGYMFEPWHYRYVGVETATLLHALGITYDEYAVWMHESKMNP
jgi:LAS superfamily LD-carboxypeptidase LdcB